uniref:Uncharacterized protein n=1 Tax=Candidatus Kentrum sp. DK TaxID=2126562 RepID=A0A450SCP1_9GAMM|nr:MAG: hypothetical protein BECKDK2373C_GA0170839_10287 [Candidatus Kentron sp. DK]
MKKYLAPLLLLASLATPATGLAMEVAPRISDREIVERLVRLEEGQKAMQRQLEQRLAPLEGRMDSLWNLMLVILAAIFGLIGFVVWDRKTALKPLEERLGRIENDLERDLDIKSSDGSRFTRLIEALREVASQDGRLADALQRYSLL